MSYRMDPPRRQLKLGNCLILVAALGALAYVGWNRIKEDPAPGTNRNARGASPNGGVGPSGLTAGDIRFFYGRSTKKWVEKATEDFNKEHKGKWRVFAESPGGSRDVKQKILYGRDKPQLWSPADIYWIDKLNLDWKNPTVGKHSSDVAIDPRPILKSLFVLLMWEDRARVFRAAMQTPQYRGKTWALLADLAAKGWTHIGGPANWGRLKLAQTEATESNSGQAALVLMLVEYHRGHPSADENDPGFLKFMRGIEGQVKRFSDTTSRMVEDFVEGGPSASDIALCYESNAMQVVDKGETRLRVVYPEKTLATNYPVATLDWPENTPAQREGARAFVDYLRSTTAQRRALDSGFRPAVEGLRRETDNALASGNRELVGFRLDPETEPDRVVSTKTIDGLIYQWFKTYGRK